ncbi:MAG TPA: hypothetical protein VFZ98_10770, partial [Vicinamibacterales bacterium]
MQYRGGKWLFTLRTPIARMVGGDRSAAAGALTDRRIRLTEAAAPEFGANDSFARFRVVEQLARCLDQFVVALR